MVLPVRSYPLREQQPWIPPHISLMAFTFYFLCCSQNNFFGSCIFLHSAACVTTHPHWRHLGLRSLLHESESICLHHQNEILFIFAELSGPWFKCWDEGRISYRAAYAIIRTCIHGTQGGAGKGEECGQLPVPALTPCPGASPSLLQKYTTRFTAASTVQNNNMIRKCFLIFAFLIKRHAQMSKKKW